MAEQKCEDPFPKQEGANYRYFNQPIEQIPGWKEGEPQILFHGKDNGLYWQSVPDKCVELAKCVTIQEQPAGEGEDPTGDYQVVATKHRIRPLQDLGELDEEKFCSDFPTEKVDIVTCMKLEEDLKLVMERKQIVVIKEFGDAQSSCDPITLPTETIDVVTCMKLETNQSDESKLVMERKQILVVKDLGNPQSVCEPVELPTEKIDVVTCIKLEGSNLVIERRQVVVVKDVGVAQTTCENIPLTECPEP